LLGAAAREPAAQGRVIFKSFTARLRRPRLALEEKGLVARRAGNVLKNKITARGRDFLDGQIKEVGWQRQKCAGIND
jgi:hypothetical protein